MKPLLVFAVLLAAVTGFLAGSGEASHVRCHTGDALGWATLRAEPQDIVYSMPAVFVDDPIYFESRYNCTRRNVLVRRLGLGVYEVMFPGLRPRAYVVTAISEEGVSTSVHNLRDGVLRIALRGPIGGDDVAARRDVAFSVIVY